MDSQERCINKNSSLHQAPLSCGTSNGTSGDDVRSTIDGVDLTLRLGSIHTGQSANTTTALIPRPVLNLNDPDTQGLNLQIGLANNDQRATAEGGPTFYGGQLPLPSPIVTQLQDIISECQVAVDFPGSSPPNVNIFINVPPPPLAGPPQAAPAPPALSDSSLIDIPVVSAISSDHLAIGSSSSRASRPRSRDVSDPEKRCKNENCRTNKTCMWRKGPLGPMTLCNACGIRYRRHKNKKRA